MKDVIIRRARDSDFPEIEEMCRLIDQEDYAPAIWPVWMSADNTVNLVAELNGRVVGCTYGEILSYPDGWSQASRVRPDHQWQGIGLKLLATLEQALFAMGATAMFGNIGAYNKASMAFFTKQNWKVVTTVNRRRSTRAKGVSRKAIPFSGEEFKSLARRLPVLASHARVDLFLRAYYSMNDRHLERAVANGDVRVSPDGDAYALLDSDKAKSKDRIWVVAMTGSLKGMQWLLEGLLAEAASAGIDLVVDAADNPGLRAVMDGMGFTEPGKLDMYSVVRKDLTAHQHAF